jgi:hypothetical protein
MEGGARPGAGRPRGPSKATIEQGLIAARTVADTKVAGKKLAKEVLEDFMHRTAEMAAHFRPALPGSPRNP